MTDTFKTGDTVFLAHGAEAVYLAKMDDGGHVVRGLYEYPWGDETHTAMGDPMMVPAVFAAPPKQKIAAELADYMQRQDAARAELATLRGQVNEARRDLKNADADNRALRAKLAQNEALKYIDDYLEGRLEWCLVYAGWYAPKIGRVKDTLAFIENGRNHGVRLLTLCGKSAGDLQWRVGSYLDEGGSSVKVWLFKTEDEAKAKAQSLYDEELAGWGRGMAIPTIHWFNCGFVTIADDHRAHVEKQVAAQKAKETERLRAELAKLEGGQ